MSGQKPQQGQVCTKPVSLGGLAAAAFIFKELLPAEKDNAWPLPSLFPVTNLEDRRDPHISFAAFFLCFKCYYISVPYPLPVCYFRVKPSPCVMMIVHLPLVSWVRDLGCVLFGCLPPSPLPGHTAVAEVPQEHKFGVWQQQLTECTLESIQHENTDAWAYVKSGNLRFSFVLSPKLNTSPSWRKKTTSKFKIEYIRVKGDEMFLWRVSSCGMLCRKSLRNPRTEVLPLSLCPQWCSQAGDEDCPAAAAVTFTHVPSACRNFVMWCLSLGQFTCVCLRLNTSKS